MRLTFPKRHEATPHPALGGEGPLGATFSLKGRRKYGRPYSGRRSKAVSYTHLSFLSSYVSHRFHLFSAKDSHGFIAAVVGAFLILMAYRVIFRRGR